MVSSIHHRLSENCQENKPLWQADLQLHSPQPVIGQGDYKVHFMAKDMRPFSIFENEGFRLLVNTLIYLFIWRDFIFYILLFWCGICLKKIQLLFFIYFLLLKIGLQFQLHIWWADTYIVLHSLYK